ncbi:MAG: hypothetical protein Q8878_03915, partial [Bacillota bacterium]|nr:hypothetical protein [Bacillota bacterium]
MAEKNDDMDLDEIRKMIGTGGTENQKFSLDDIINEVHDEEKKETIKKRKKEEEEDPFLFLMHETGSIDAAAEQEKKVPAVKPEEKTESEAPGETEAPQEIKARDDQATAEANPVAAEKTAEAKKLPDTFITGEPEAPEEFGEPEEPEKRPEKKKKARAALPPADFDRTDFETPEQATAYLKKREVSQYLRSVLALLAGLLSAYLTLSPTFALPLPFSFSYIETPYLFIFSLIAILIFCMLISLELIAAGFFRLFTG